jgi:hypothetical protein
LTQPKSYRINKNLAAKHGDLMFYQVGVVVKRFKRFYQRLGDICIGSIENTEFCRQGFIRILETSHFTLDVIDAFE